MKSGCSIFFVIGFAYSYSFLYFPFSGYQDIFGEHDFTLGGLYNGKHATILIRIFSLWIKEFFNKYILKANVSFVQLNMIINPLQLTGCGLIALGIWLNVDQDEWEGVSDFDYLSVANVAIAAGAIIMIVAFLGCCGAITENKIMLLGVSHHLSVTMRYRQGLPPRFSYNIESISAN